ncbi:MAG: peptidylprolyl isomerase [Gammaproteobacteria bacterium]|nr:peptidylprolyl isomerase [Gammaproteobacteria bacterium]
METSLGTIILELDPVKAPKSVANFLGYVESGFYNETIFHRVINNFMIQGGGFTQDFQRKRTNAPVANEADNGLKNLNGTIAMARTQDPHSATAQFFINVKDNSFLDHTRKSARGWGYAVFGKVIEGMDTVKKIRQVQTGAGGPFPSDVPEPPVIIKSMTLINAMGTSTDAPAKPIAPAIQ